MLTVCDLLSREILAKLLVLEDPTAWRLRQVLQCTPLTPDSYSARISVQLHLTRTLVDDAWDKAFDESPNPPRRPRNEIEIFLPIHYFPKQVLIDFSLEGPDGKALPLLTSGITNFFSLGAFARFVTELDQSLGDGLQTSGAFFAEHYNIITCLIFTGQGDIGGRLEDMKCFRRTPFEFEFQQEMLRYYEKILVPLTGVNGLDANTVEHLRPALSSLYQSIWSMDDELKVLLGGTDGFRMPLLNPGLLVVDYLRNGPPSEMAELANGIEQCLHASAAFLNGIQALRADRDRFDAIVAFLSRLTKLYVAYTRVNVPIGRDFVIKTEQVVPIEIEHVQRLLGAWHYQDYKVPVGGTRSTHIEVTSGNPVELQQVPRRSRVVFNDTTTETDTVFSIASHATSYRQHFYTNMGLDEVVRVARSKQIEGAEPGYLALRVFYTVEMSTMLGYWLVTFIAIAALMLFVRLYEPGQITRGQMQLVPLIPLLFGFVGALSALKAQENLVAIRVRKHKIFVLATVFLMTAYLLLGLTNPGAVSAFRDAVGRLPWVGALFTGTGTSVSQLGY